MSLNALHKELGRVESRQRYPSKLYWGFMDGRAKPQTKGRWSEQEWRLCDRYLPYALGGGYVLGRRLVDYIANNAALLKRFASEDVSVGAWLAGLEVEYWHDSRFNTEWKSRGCFNSYLVTHKQTDSDMRQMYQSLIASGYICSKEHRERLSYEYNWNVSLIIIPSWKLCDSLCTVFISGATVTLLYSERFVYSLIRLFHWCGFTVLFVLLLTILFFRCFFTVVLSCVRKLNAFFLSPSSTHFWPIVVDCREIGRLPRMIFKQIRLVY